LSCCSPAACFFRTDDWGNRYGVDRISVNLHIRGCPPPHLEKIRELAELLDRYDVGIEIVRSERPGYVIYEDDAQIIAEPFRDTPTGNS